MKAATGLASGDQALPRLAEAAVQQALAQLGESRAGSILLYLTPDFSRHPEAALKAGARAGACLQVCGGLVAQPFTEREAVLDRPAAAALVLCDLPAAAAGQHSWLTYRSHHPAAPQAWQDGPRFGIECAEGSLWCQGRLQESHSVSPEFPGLSARLEVSLGLQKLSPPLEITAASGHQLLNVGHSPAQESLRRALPPELRQAGLHSLFAIPPQGPAIPILEAHPEGQLTLARPLPAGTTLSWAARLPLGAEAELGRQLDTLALAVPQPGFGLMFACIGRGPWFHNGEERNQAAWQERFADLPLLGAYGDSQIIPHPDGGARLQHNSVVTALFSQET